ncbi:MAG: hypothetical protein ABH834_00140 [Candidatus Altiarchaeota archaeon]
MRACPQEHIKCVNCASHFRQLRPLIRETVASKHFLRDAPDFDAKMLLDCEHEHFTHLHKFEELVGGNHIFRALWQGKHIVYAVDLNHRLVLLRAFKNIKDYQKFLEDEKNIKHMLTQ